jgi:glutamyl-tRNA reductase
VELARKVFGDLSELEVLFIGAGEMAELALLHLKENGLKRIRVANRTVDKAAELAGRFQGEAHALADVPALLARSDLVLSCTSSPAPLVAPAMAREALRKRKQAPMVFIDMAVPADIDREVGSIEGAYLYTIDDLQGVVEQNLKERARRMEVAGKLVEEEVEKFMDRWANLKISPLIQEINAYVRGIQRQELDKFLKRHPGYTEEQARDLEAYTSSLLAKLLHSPLMHIKQAKPEKRTQLLIKKYFGLGEK